MNCGVGPAKKTQLPGARTKQKPLKANVVVLSDVNSKTVITRSSQASTKTPHPPHRLRIPKRQHLSDGMKLVKFLPDAGLACLSMSLEELGFDPCAFS